MSRFSVAVALFDFVPVAVGAFAVATLAAAIARRQPALRWAAWSGAAMVAAGGLCKASWKLTLAATGVDVPLLNNLLFILLAPGFAALALSLGQIRRSVQSGLTPTASGPDTTRLLLWTLSPLALALGLALAMPATRLWFVGLLAATTVCNALLLLQAARTARALSLGQGVTLALAFSFMASLLLGGLARLPDGEQTAWLQQSVNLSAQAALAFGLWRLSRALVTRNTFP